MAVQILVWPAGFLSCVFVDPGTMPGRLGAVADWNPPSATVTAIRGLFGNPGFGGGSWIAQHATLMAIVWPALLIVVFLPLSVRTFAKPARCPSVSPPACPRTEHRTKNQEPRTESRLRIR